MPLDISRAPCVLCIIEQAHGIQYLCVSWGFEAVGARRNSCNEVSARLLLAFTFILSPAKHIGTSSVVSLASPPPSTWRIERRAQNLLEIKGGVLSSRNKGGGSGRNKQRGPTESATRPRLKQVDCRSSSMEVLNSTYIPVQYQHTAHHTYIAPVRAGIQRCRVT